MEAVVWLERYLATYKGILLLVSHSQDFMNNVATDTVRMYKKRLDYFGGNYDTYIATREELEENQMKRFEKQQSDVAALKDFVARFGHGTKKMAQQAQSREKLLAKVLEEGAVEKVEKEAVIRMRFPDPGTMPPPVLQLQNISFAYPGCELLYENVDFGVDLDSRIGESAGRQRPFLSSWPLFAAEHLLARCAARLLAHTAAGVSWLRRFRSSLHQFLLYCAAIAP